jgi:hypothetical protein
LPHCYFDLHCGIRAIRVERIYPGYRFPPPASEGSRLISIPTNLRPVNSNHRIADCDGPSSLYTVGARAVRVIAAALILPPSSRIQADNPRETTDDQISGSVNRRRKGETPRNEISLSNALPTGRRGFSFHRVTHARAPACVTRVYATVFAARPYILITRFVHNRISARSLVLRAAALRAPGFCLLSLFPGIFVSAITSVREFLPYVYYVSCNFNVLYSPSLYTRLSV